MTGPRARWLAVAMVAAGAAMLVTALAFHAVGWSQCTAAWRATSAAAARACDIITRSDDLGGTVEMVAFGGVGLVFTVLGAVLATKRPDNVLGWVFGVAGLLFTGNAFLNTYTIHAATEAPGSLPGATVAAVGAEVLGGPAIFTPFVFFFLLFPDGRLLSRRWRPVSWLLAAAVTAHAATLLLHDRPLRLAPLISNPLGMGWVAGVQDAVDAGSMLVLFGSLAAAVISLVLRFRRSQGVLRQQMRWFATSAAFVGVTLIAGPLLFWPNPALEVLWGPLFLLATLSVPAAATIAILRYRLYDLDVLVNRALVYGALTGLLGAVYLGLVVAMQAALSGLGGGSDIAVAGSTLAVAALFRPARARVQAFINRRFYRRKYDALHTVEAFSARLRQETDVAALRSELLQAVHTTIQPARAAVWLRGDQPAQ